MGVRQSLLATVIITTDLGKNQQWTLKEWNFNEEKVVYTGQSISPQRTWDLQRRKT